MAHRVEPYLCQQRLQGSARPSAVIMLPKFPAEAGSGRGWPTPSKRARNPHALRTLCSTTCRQKKRGLRRPADEADDAGCRRSTDLAGTSIDCERTLLVTAAKIRIPCPQNSSLRPSAIQRHRFVQSQESNTNRLVRFPPRSTVRMWCPVRSGTVYHSLQSGLHRTPLLAPPTFLPPPPQVMRMPL